ncbi:hypothetical protein HPB50_003336 [Hyalomma asiaticum]|uniref:Uncharacterized protein n=1 Tax=Hyalomma asiaticum TaxID=266040 RepID=A0ACB7SPL9_HYAAI|nr:hypothetical protein HPB50_003336 [Hyalomma asiaticum]
MCQRLDEVQSFRLQQNSDPRLLPHGDLRALIRSINREELQEQKQRRSTVAPTPSPSFDLRSLVKQEFATMTMRTPISPAACPMLTHADIAVILPSAATSRLTDLANGHVASEGPRASAASSHTQWRLHQTSTTFEG